MRDAIALAAIANDKIAEFEPKKRIRWLLSELNQLAPNRLTAEAQGKATAVTEETEWLAAVDLSLREALLVDWLREVAPEYLAD